MDIKKEAERLYIETQELADEYESICKLLEYPEVYLDTKYSTYLLKSKAQIEDVAIFRAQMRDYNERNDPSLRIAVDHLKGKLIVLGADTVMSCTIELSGALDCIDIIRNNISDIVTANRWEQTGDCIKGFGAYAYLSRLAGSHHFKGTPSGFVHVYVYPNDSIPQFKLEDVEIDYFHSDGAGGQNVNKVETGIRAKHIPTGVMVVCKDERSQLMNKERALKRLEEQVASFYAKENKKKKDEIKKKQRYMFSYDYLNGTKI